MAMYNLLEYNKNYKKRQVVCGIITETSQITLFFLFLNLLNTRQTSVTGNNYNLVSGDADYDATKVGKNETKVVIPLKHLSSFWRTLNMPLINCELELILT